MDLKKGWIILDSITYISCHMDQHRRKFFCIHRILILHQSPGGLQGDGRCFSQQR